MSEDPEERAAQFLQRREESDWSAADERERRAWLEESMANKAAYWRLQFGWTRTNRLRSLRAAKVPAPRYAQLQSRHRWAIALVPIVAAIVIVLSTYRPQKPPSARQDYQTKIGQHSSVRLPDGTMLDLNTHSAAHTIEARTRELWLDHGEIFLRVAHHPTHPFLLHSGTRRILVIGTQFAVRLEDDHLTVLVTDGRVLLSGEEESNNVRSLILERGDIATTRGENALVEHPGVSAINDRLSWRQGYLFFDRTTLAEAATEFNRYNVRQIHINDPKAAVTEVGGSFKTDNVDKFVKLLTDAYGVRVQSTSDGVEVTAK